MFQLQRYNCAHLKIIYSKGTTFIDEGSTIIFVSPLSFPSAYDLFLCNRGYSSIYIKDLIFLAFYSCALCIVILFLFNFNLGISRPAKEEKERNGVYFLTSRTIISSRCVVQPWPRRLPNEEYRLLRARLLVRLSIWGVLSRVL